MKNKSDSYIDLSYPVKYRKGVKATIITGADGYQHYFYPEDGYMDYDGGETTFVKGKIVRAKSIIGVVRLYLPIKSIKIGTAGNLLTIVDAKRKKYVFS